MNQVETKRRRHNGRHFEVRNALTGEVIDVHPCRTRIDENTIVEWLLPEVAAKLSWPASYVRLMVAETVVVYTHRIRDRNQTFMKNLDPTAEVLALHARKMPRPEYFEGVSELKLCLCDFGGCCCYCMVPESGCNGCGNNGCCRSGNCSHECCERYDRNQFSNWHHGFTDRCPQKGCKPSWAAKQVRHECMRA